MKREMCSKGAWLFTLSALVLFLVIGLGARPASAVPVLQVGLCATGDSPCTTFVSYSPGTVGGDEDTAFGLYVPGDAFALWIGGAEGVTGGIYGLPISTSTVNSPILVVSVPEDSDLSSGLITVNGANRIATFTDIDPYLDNHYPTDGSGTTADFMYFSLGDGSFTFGSGLLRNFDGSGGTADGQEVPLSVVITGSYAWVHFDLIGKPTTRGDGTISVVSNSASHDATLTPVPEPGTLLLLGTGLIGAAGFARRRFLKRRNSALQG